jgi:ATP-dependent RNA helicase RhlE
MNSSFSSLGLLPTLVRVVDELGYLEPTPIQREVVPAVLAGRDVWGQAQTGSGKTASFALPILQRLATTAGMPSRDIRALVLAPTRELAMQISETFRTLSVHLEDRPRVRVVVGGVSINPQMLDLRGGADVLVATPGRLLDLHSKNAVVLRALETLVLDEADRLLEGQFAEELHRVLELVPPRRQMLLFSATFPTAVLDLAAEILRDPVRVELIEEADSAPQIRERAIEVDEARRGPLLRKLLSDANPDRSLVFVASGYEAEHVAEKLRLAGLFAGALHGELTQGARTRVLDSFRSGTTRVLVATDVAARGLDVVGLPLVVNYDLPRSTVDYTHRIGRTGRAGRVGEAISFVTAQSDAHFRLIERRHALAATREQIAGFEPTDTPPVHTPTGGVKGRRKSKKDKLREAGLLPAKKP